MNKTQLIIAVCITLLTGTTACKTKQVVEKKQPTQTESITTVNKNYTPLPSGLFNGEWIIDNAMNQPTIGNEVVNIIFDKEKKQVYGNNGCNTFSGTLVCGEDCAIAFTNCITTLMACHPEVTETNVMQALGATTHYTTVEHNNDKITIDLLDKDGNAVATLTRQVSQQISGYWNIIEVNGKKIKLDAMPTMVLDLEENKLTGNSGCNIMNGTIVHDLKTNNNKISFTGIATTRRMCAPNEMEVEDNVLDALNHIDAFRILNDQNIELYSTHNNKISLKLQRI